MAVADLAWQDYGLVGLIVGPVMATFLWFVRAARTDLNRAHEDFTTYLKDTAARQTEALVSVGNALQMSIEQNKSHEDRALQRHEALMERIEDLGVRR